jgi:hypothetical protein
MLPPNRCAAKQFAGLACTFLSTIFAAACLGLLGDSSLRAADQPIGFTHGDWPFQPLKKPSIPAVKRTDWVKNPIDAFVLARLDAKG